MSQYTTTYTMAEILEIMKGNKSKVARRLNINRRTISKYEADKDNTRHVIFVVSGSFKFMNVTKEENTQ